MYRDYYDHDSPAQLQRYIRERDESIATMGAQMSDLEATIRVLTRNADAARAQREELESDLFAAREDLREQEDPHEEEIERLSNEVAELSDENSSLSDSLYEAQNEISDLKDEIEALEKKLQKASKKKAKR